MYYRSSKIGLRAATNDKRPTKFSRAVPVVINIVVGTVACDSHICHPLFAFPIPEDPMPCKPEILRQVPLFALLDDDETAVLAAQVEVRNFAPRQRIHNIGAPGDR